MRGEDWRVVAKFAVMSAIGGPLLGVILFWWLPLVLVVLISWSLGDLYLVTGSLLMNVAILFPSNAPSAAAFGALGTWLLIVLRARGRSKRTVRLTGIGYGFVAGAAMSVLSQAQGDAYSNFGGGLGLLLGALYSGLGSDATFPVIALIGSTVAGGGTGVLLGSFIAARVGRQTGSERMRGRA